MHTLSTTPDPRPDWSILANRLLSTLGKPRNRAWMFAPRDQAAPVFDQDDDDFADILPDLDTLTHPVAADADLSETHRPRAAPLAALLRLARSFETLEEFWARLTEPGALLVLTTGDPEYDKYSADVLRRLVTAYDDWPPRRTPRIYLAQDAVKSGLAGAAEGGGLGELCRDFRAALENGDPLVLIGVSAATLPRAVAALSPRDIPLAPLDRDILRAYLWWSFSPAARADADALAQCLGAVRVAQLSLLDLTLAQRAPGALDAARMLCARTQPAAPSADTPRLQDFPIPLGVRDAMEQMVADMRLWRAGELDWAEVMRGILLHGPTGSGKTEIARQLARESGLSVHAGSLSKWMGRSARSGDTIREMRRFFEAAAADAPCVIFVDELDAIGDRDRPHDHNSSWTDGVVTAFLDCVDGFEQTEGVVLLGATNHLRKLDDAILRPGRFDKLLRLDYPTVDQLPQVFRWHLKSDLPDADLSYLSNKAVGMSGAMIGGLVRDVRARARRARRPLNLDDLAAALSVYRPERPQAHRHRIAAHEAGHAIVAVATGAFTPRMVAILSDGGVAEQTPRPTALRREDLEAEITTLLAGRAAEKLVFGAVSGGAGGAEDSDLARANARAAALELSYGLGVSGPIWLGAPQEAVAQLRRDSAMRSIVQNRLTALEKAAGRILQDNRGVLDDLAAALLEAGVLHAEELVHYTDRLQNRQRG